MDSELLQVIAPYAPFLVVAIAFFLQAKIFATPAQLEAVHREILEDKQICILQGLEAI